MMEEMRELAKNDAISSYGMQIEEPEVKVRRVSNRCMIGVVILISGFTLVLGIVIGWATWGNKPGTKNPVVVPETFYQDSRLKDGTSYILENMKKDNIRENLKNYTSQPRLAGTKLSLELVDILAYQWKQNGLDKVDTPAYNVLLSYPNKSNPNKIEIVTTNGTETGIQSTIGDDLGNEGQDTEKIPAYHAFSPNGTEEGDLVYVNYGTITDLLFLTVNLSINLTGKIAIARYGNIYRGDKVLNAQSYGMIGVVMYTDPADYVIGNINDTYPNSWWLPSDGVQRGTVGADGDYLTPLYPAKEYAYREKNKSSLIKIKIPSQPIGYGDAYKFLSRMGGVEAPKDWQGKLNITYNLGPGFTNTSLKTRLIVNNNLERRTIKNVIGYIKGQEEPDRYVLLGNHHDAWMFGAIDPLSGTATLTEVTRVMGEMLKKGHRPRRTLVFCAWDGEEIGLLGSTEWVEENMKVLFERAVAYINVDYAADYHDYFTAGTSPLLQDPLYEAAKQVPNPGQDSALPTLYDVWKERNPMNKTDPNSEASVFYSLGSSSDQATFYQRAGCPSIDMWYTYDKNHWPVLDYPVYHTAYETYKYFSTFVDPSFNFTLATGHLWAVLSWNLANVNVLTFDVRRYSTAILTFVQNLDDTFGEVWKGQSIKIGDLQSAANQFAEATQNFHRKMQEPVMSALQARILNDKMMKLERAFIDPEGLPSGRQYKHVVFAPSQFDSYKDNSFPGIVDTMYNIQQVQPNTTDLWELLKRQVSLATYTILSAACTLDDVGLIV